MQARSRTRAIVVVNLVATLLVGLEVAGYRYELQFNLLEQAWRAHRASDALSAFVAVLVCVLAARTRLARFGWYLSAAGTAGMWCVSYVGLASPLPVYEATLGLAVGLLISGVVAALVTGPRLAIAIGLVGGVAIGLLDQSTMRGLNGGLVFPTGLTLMLSLAGFLALQVGPAPSARLDRKEIAGIVDGTSVRTSGYLPGRQDVALTPGDVSRYGLRRGDAVTGVARERSRTLVRVDAVNGLAPLSVTRPDFAKLATIEPHDRLRLDSGNVTARVVDLVMPIGKGQRALIVAPPGAGATTTLRAIGDALPSGCHRMLLLVDQRPEDVVAIRRDTTNGEVIASTVDMHPASHVELAALALDRARRLVELGHDVVVLLDSVTRLGRAYQAASGRWDGLDAAAVSALRQFLGAARAIEGGGSLTILAVATVDTGSPIEAAILDELKDTANASLRLRSDSTVDVSLSGTRRVDLLQSAEEQAAAARLRELLPTMDPDAALHASSVD